MNYIMFDLEFNQDSTLTKEERTKIAPNCPFEVIQLGAVKLNEKLETVSTFNRLVKPVIYKNLNSYVREMTGLTMEVLNTADTFEIVFRDFAHFLGSDKNILVVWGKADIKELYKNIQYHSLDWNLISKEYIDIQRHTSKNFKLPRGINLGLSKAVELLGIEASGNFHDAFGDACYTAEVFKKMINTGIKSIIYDPQAAAASPRPVKQQTNYNKLYSQFEKMYGREMTMEEKDIIKLAYIMGRTHQFSK